MIFDSPAFTAGKEARIAKGISKQPHPPRTQEAEHWEKGFMVADMAILALQLNKGPSNRQQPGLQELTEEDLQRLNAFLFILGE